MWKRLFRSALATAVGVVAAKYQNNEIFVSLTPILMAGAKSLRDKYPENDLVRMIPF